MKSNKLKSQKLIGASFASTVLAAALVATPTVSHAGDKERCSDVVKAGKNGCAVKALGLSCMGSASEDNLKGAWIKVPAGTCENIVSICAGTVEAPEGTNEKKLAKACDKIAEQTDETVVGGQVVDKDGSAIM